MATKDLESFFRYYFGEHKSKLEVYIKLVNDLREHFSENVFIEIDEIYGTRYIAFDVNPVDDAYETAGVKKSEVTIDLQLSTITARQQWAGNNSGINPPIKRLMRVFTSPKELAEIIFHLIIDPMSGDSDATT